MALGAGLIASPRLGAAVVGLPAPEGVAAAWVAVVGVRDLAFGSYVLALLAFAGPRAAAVALAVTTLIPLGDLALLLAVGAPAARLLPHLLSLLVMAGAARLVWRNDC